MPLRHSFAKHRKLVFAALMVAMVPQVATAQEEPTGVPLSLVENYIRNNPSAALGVVMEALDTGAVPAGGPLASKPVLKNEAAVRQIVRDYIRNNPDEIRGLLAGDDAGAGEARQQEGILAELGGPAAPVVSGTDQEELDVVEKLVTSEGAPVLGAPDATTTVTFFYDQGCHPCARFAPALEKLVRDDPQIRVIYRDVSVPDDVKARLAVAVWQTAPEHFAEFHNLILAHPAAIDPEVAQDLLVDVLGDELSREAWEQAFGAAEASVTELLEANRALAEALDFDDIPRIHVNGEGAVFEGVPLFRDLQGATGGISVGQSEAG